MNIDFLFTHGHAPLDVALFAFLLLFMPAFAAWSGARLRRTPLDHTRRMRRYWQTVMRGWIVALALIAIWSVAKRPWVELGLDWPVGFWGLCGFGLGVLLSIVLAVEFMRIPKLVGTKLETLKARMRDVHILPHQKSELLLFVVMALTAGVWEELAYRGFLMWFLAPLSGLTGAIIISSLIFGLGHLYQGWKGVLRTAVVGLVFAIGFAVSHSLWWLMVVHALLDIFGGLLGWRIFNMQRTPEADASV